MPSLSARLGLKRPQISDAFSTQDIYDSYTLLDGYPGTFICTSSTRPGTWGVAQSGQYIFETDTSLMWRWSGSAWVRARPLGLLGHTPLTSDFATAATSPTSASPSAVAMTCTVSVPATTAGSTTRRIRVTASWYRIDNGTATTLGAAEVSLYRDGTPTLLGVAGVRGRPATAASPLDWGSGGSLVAYDTPAVAGGTITYSLRINSLAAIGGTTTLRASATTPAALVVEEIGT